jgi:hypothetical protein
MMKTKVAMAISLAGVLAAGTAAALVNTRVLNGGSTSAPSAGAASTSRSTATDIAAPNVSAPMESVPSSVANSPTQATYAVGTSGTVTLDTAGDVLTVAAAAPAPGWTVAQSEKDETESNVEVKFQNGSVELDFHANLLYGVVRTSVETHDLSAASSTVAGSGSDDQTSNTGNGQSTVPTASVDRSVGDD